MSLVSEKPLGCVVMPMVGVQAEDTSASYSLVDHLQSNPTIPCIGKKESKCIRAFGKDYTIKIREGLSMRDITDNANKVVVGRVHG